MTFSSQESHLDAICSLFWELTELNSKQFGEIFKIVRAMASSLCVRTVIDIEKLVTERATRNLTAVIAKKDN